MNKIKYFGIILLVIIAMNSSDAQNVLYKEKLNLNGAARTMKDLQICRADSNKDLAVFLYSDLNNMALLLDSNRNEKGRLEGRRPRLLFSTNIGQSFYDNLYYSYYTDGVNNNLSAHIFDFEQSAVHYKSVRLHFVKNESVIGQFTVGKYLYFLTLMKNSSKLALYRYLGLELLDRKKIVLEDKYFPHFLRDNLYNCISHDVLRPVNLDYKYNYVFSDKEDYLMYDNENIYLISNSNTVVTIDLKTVESKVVFFPKEKSNSSIPEVFKNFEKEHRVRAFIADQKYFRASENNGYMNFEIYDLLTQNLELDTILGRSEVLEHALVTDRLHRKKLVKEDSYKSITKGKLAFRCFIDGSNYSINIGRDFDRLFEIDHGYFELKVGRESLTILKPNTMDSELNMLRIESQNLDYEYFEIIYKNDLDNLKLIQFNKKEKVLQIID